MIEHLNRVNTPFIITFLDDYFLRAEVDIKKVEQCVEWLKADSQAAQFYFTRRVDNRFTISKKYPGFVEIDRIAPYKLNLTAGIWKTEVYKSFWSPKASPWSWECFSTINTFDSKYKFYAVEPDQKAIIDFGYKIGKPWGIVRGKWVVSDVDNLFKENGISVDYSIRGEYSCEDLSGMVSSPISKEYLIDMVGKKQYKMIRGYERRKWLYSLLRKEYYHDYVDYLRRNTK